MENVSNPSCTGTRFPSKLSFEKYDYCQQIEVENICAVKVSDDLPVSMWVRDR